MNFSSFYNKWLQVEPTIQKTFVEELDNDLIIGANQNVLEEGKNPESLSDFPEYTNFTLRVKRETGGFISPSGNIALKDTGAFYESMKVIKNDEFAKIMASDEKTSMLIGKWGETILNVPNKDILEIVEEARPGAIKTIKTKLGLS